MLNIKDVIFLESLARLPITDDVIVITIHNDKEVSWRAMGEKDLYYYVGILQGTIHGMIQGGNYNE